MLPGYRRSLLRSDAVDDLFQETMLTAWRRLPDYDQDAVCPRGARVGAA